MEEPFQLIQPTAVLNEEKKLEEGFSPAERIFTMENHDKAYYIWRDLGVKEKILVHIDAHHDMGWIEKNSDITIANFICPALKEGMVKELYWIVPDQTWETLETRKPLLQHLKRILKRYPGKSPPIKIENDKMSTILLGKRFTVCTLSSLPETNERVLLDIDVDYFVIPRVSYRKSDIRIELPWCWPEEFMDQLRAKNLCSDCITIAYSVEGNYTLLKWKYLGDELALRFQNSIGPGQKIHAMKLIREGATEAFQGNLDLAEKKYLQAKDLLPSSAGPYYHLALLYTQMGKKGEARAFYQEAVAKDSTYKTPYNNLGPTFLSEDRFLEAEKEYHKALTLDLKDAYAYFGLGQLAYKKRKWREAEIRLRQSIEFDEQLIDAYRMLADVFVKQGKNEEEAIRLYERFLLSVLKGYRSFEAPIITCVGVEHPIDPHYSSVYARLARLYAKKGRIHDAVNGYRMSIAGKYDGARLRLSLAQLYLKQGEGQKAIHEFLQAVIRIPADLWGIFTDFI